MKTQISFKKLDGDEGVALTNGSVTDPNEAKQALARHLDLLDEDGSNDREDIDERLRKGGVDPTSIQTAVISE